MCAVYAHSLSIKKKKIKKSERCSSQTSERRNLDIGGKNVCLRPGLLKLSRGVSNSIIGLLREQGYKRRGECAVNGNANANGAVTISPRCAFG